ncbi:MAG: prepilin-type N-terminal cleavage/methylation domain-containing protein [Rubrivivax sp.]|jgi:type IV fimbrial biogenesis protein FimT|nr:prepilin-type N-terminal cleavage/methylation domain-containing protein [Rubrivivax sp.]
MRRGAQQAFTVIELIVVIAVVGVVLAIAGPAFTDYLLVQRLKGVHAQLVTDLQYGRGEAVARNIAMRFVFRSDDSRTCYTLYTVAPGSSTGLRCNCLLGAGSACSSASATEVRTHSVQRSTGVRFVTPDGVDPAFAIDHVSGGLLAIPSDQLSSPLAAFTVDTTIAGPRTLRTTIGRAGRVTSCATDARLGATPC